jgi:hypothetical protein
MSSLVMTSSHLTQIKCLFFKGTASFIFSLTYLLVSAAISLNQGVLKIEKNLFGETGICPF